MRRAYLRLSGATPQRARAYQDDSVRRRGHSLAERAPYGAPGLLLNQCRYNELPHFLAVDPPIRKFIRCGNLTVPLGFRFFILLLFDSLVHL